MPLANAKQVPLLPAFIEGLKSVFSASTHLAKNMPIGDEMFGSELVIVQLGTAAISTRYLSMALKD